MILLGMSKVIGHQGKVQAVSNLSNCTFMYIQSINAKKNGKYKKNLQLRPVPTIVSVPTVYTSKNFYELVYKKPVETVCTTNTGPVCLLTNKIFHYFQHINRVLSLLYISLNLKSLDTSPDKLQVFYSSWT